MAERWVNAVIQMTVVLDVSPDASDDAKQEAVVEAMERLLPDDQDVVANGRWEVVDDA